MFSSRTISLLVVLSLVAQAMVLTNTDNSSNFVEDSSPLEQVPEYGGARADEPIRIHEVRFSNTPFGIPGTNSVYFSGYDDSSSEGYELWKSDGTTEGTVVVKDIKPGSAGSSPRYFAYLNGKTYFVADDGTHGGELWVTDGTEEGTVMIKDIFVGDEYDDGYPQSITAEGDKLFFTADDGTHGRELWVSDGSEEGTFMVKDINPGEEFGQINTGANHCPYSHLVNNEYHLRSTCFIGSEGSVFFSADSDGSGGDTPTLWKSDGTENGTVEFEDVLSPEYFNVLGNKVIFFARNGSYDALWETDGTEEGTVVIHNNVEGTWGHVVNDKLFFHGQASPDSENTRVELWVSDGTGDGTYIKITYTCKIVDNHFWIIKCIKFRYFIRP